MEKTFPFGMKSLRNYKRRNFAQVYRSRQGLQECVVRTKTVVASLRKLKRSPHGTGKKRICDICVVRA